MPELPEVEVTRLSFADRIAGARIESAAIGKPLRWPLGIAPQTLQDRQVLRVRRRGKYLLLDLDHGLLLIHLGMSGSLAFADQLPAAGLHDHFELVTSQGRLRLHDPRRFGAVVWAESEADPIARKLLGHLGVEPLGSDFDPLVFWQALQARCSAIKQVLLAGDIVVGVGNIYASEALFVAGIAPTLSASGLSQVRAERLHGAIHSVLARALEQGGSTLKDFSSAEGKSGYFQLEAMVYDRAGQPCRACGATIQTLRQGQRSTFFCPDCQTF